MAVKRVSEYVTPVLKLWHPRDKTGRVLTYARVHHVHARYACLCACVPGGVSPSFFFFHFLRTSAKRFRIRGWTSERDPFQFVWNDRGSEMIDVNRAENTRDASTLWHFDTFHLWMAMTMQQRCRDVRPCGVTEITLHCATTNRVKIWPMGAF